MTYGQERLQDMQAEMELLHPLHWAETKTGNILDKQNFAWASFYRMQDAGILQCIAARHEGRLVGYCLSVLMPHLHSGDLTAMADNYFLHPAHRGGRNGLRLLQAVERGWNQAGAKVGIFTTKREPDHSRLLEYMGWKLEEKLYAKRLGKTWE